MPCVSYKKERWQIVTLAPLEYKNGNKPIPKGGHGVQMAFFTMLGFRLCLINRKKDDCDNYGNCLQRFEPIGS